MSALKSFARRLPIRFAHWLPVVSAVALAMTLSACSKPEPAPAQPEPTVAGELISFPGNQDPPTLRLVSVANPTDHQVVLTGRLAWDEDHTSRVYAPYSGRIDKLLVSVGQSVKRGDALAVMSSADIGQAQADLHKAEADQALGRSAVARLHDLVEGGVVARKELDQAQADLARASAEAGRARARLAQYGVVGAAGGSVNQSFMLRSPVAGTVVERNSNPGAEVRTDVAGPALFTISDPGTLWANVDIDETQLGMVQPGQMLLLTVVAWPEREFSATVLSIGESVDPNSRTVKLRARVPNTARQLKAEMFVRASLSQRGSLPLVPADAVFLRGDKQALFVHKGPGKFERRDVKLRPAGPAAWSVLQGVDIGDQVVVGGGLYLNQLLDTAK